MATHKKELSVTDLQQKILSDSLYNDTDNAGIDEWLQGALDGKVNNCWKRMHKTWSDKLTNDPSFTDPIPSNKEDFVTLVLAQPDYKTAKQRQDS